jgi:hypothetical protein
MQKTKGACGMNPKRALSTMMVPTTSSNIKMVKCVIMGLV